MRPPPARRLTEAYPPRDGEGGRRGGLWSEWARTLLNVILDRGVSPQGMSPVSGTGSERAQGRELRLRGPLREQGSPVAGAASRRSGSAVRVTHDRSPPPRRLRRRTRIRDALSRLRLRHKKAPRLAQ